MTRLILAYRRRTVHRGSSPDDPSHHDVICAAFWEKQQVRTLEAEARRRGYEIWWEEVPVRSQVYTQNPPTSVYVLFQGGIEQRHPEALEIADPVGQAAYFTQQDVQQFLENNPNWEWGDVWKLPVPWQSPYALNPFPKTRYSGFPADYEFSP